MRGRTVGLPIPPIRLPRLPRDAVDDWRIGECRTSMGGIIELAPCRMTQVPKPVLDHLPHDCSIPDWSDAAEWRWRRQVAAERWRPDRYGEQPFVIVNPLCPAEQLDVEAVRATRRPRFDP